MSRIKFISVFTGLLLMPFSLPAEGIVVGGTSVNGAFPLAENNTAATLVVDNADAEVVKIAAQSFANDINLLTGVTPPIKTAPDNSAPVIIGTLGKSALIDQLSSSGKIDPSRLAGKWETFCISVVDNPVSGLSKALVIAGSDPRGTAFGVFELSRMMGVSPWVWWADVTPEPREAIYVSGDELFGPPSVKYRGMFINDEDWGFQPWAAKNMDVNIRPDGTGDAGPNTYVKIFELMLRLKSNYIWPAKRPCTKSFWFYPQNRELALRYGVVMGSSHNEQMLRDNLDEWTNNFQSEYGMPSGDFNWATNSAKIKTYWTDRVIQSKNHEAIYTLGMRAVNDRPMLGYDTDEQRKNALIDIIQNQRTILTTHLEKPVTGIPQLFCPYKETLPVYRLGIDLPEDVTLLWVDDNHGFMRQLPAPTEQARSGGSGIYYHYSYNGSPQSYLWIGTTSPALAVFEMKKAYEMNCRQIWMFNVGDLKPAEFEFQYSMDLAWDIHSIDLETANLYAEKWGAETFGEPFGEAIYKLKKEYFYLCSSGKPEHIVRLTFSVSEMEERLARFDKLTKDVRALEDQIPGRLKDAYFQLIKYPMEAAADMNIKLLGAKLSFEYAAQGREDEALAWSEKSMAAYQEIVDLTQKYNKEIAGGKWDGMMDYAPLGSNSFYEPTVYTLDGPASASGMIPSKPARIHVITAGNYDLANSAGYNFKQVEGLGVAENGMTVWPLNMTAYTSENIASAPSLEYSVQVSKGMNTIQVQCLPTFPLYTGLQLRYALSIENSTPVFMNIESVLDNDSGAEWGQNVMQGYAQGTTVYVSDDDKTIRVKVYFPDPGLVVSAIKVTCAESNPLTGQLVNADFEYQSEGALNDGTTFRGVPYGWSQTGTLNGNSYGINNDAANKSGNNACWFSSTPMPANFELYQIVRGLPEGEYIVRCRMACMEGGLTNQRLFANQNVHYFGSKADYVSNLTAGETNTFAGWSPGASNGAGAPLREMAVKVSIFAGDSLKLGLRSSNKKSDGTNATNNSGWFKADNFNVECVKLFSDGKAKNELDSLLQVANDLLNTTVEGTAIGQYPAHSRSAFGAAIQTATAVSNNAAATLKEMVETANTLEAVITAYRNSLLTATSYMVNPGFEYKNATQLNDGSTVRGTPYGWTDTGGLSGSSWGINNGAVNLSGNNVCWYQSTPMPATFELSQTVTGLPAGDYTVSCRLAVMDGKISTQRLFANNNTQYFGKESDYGANLVPGENATFAGWTTSAAYYLKSLSVDVTLAGNEPLKLGIRTTNKKANGQTATDNSGWFKADDFQIKIKSASGIAIEQADESRFVPQIYACKGGLRIDFAGQPDKAVISVYSLLGNTVVRTSTSQNAGFISLSPGVYVVKVNRNGYQAVEKVIVK